MVESNSHPVELLLPLLSRTPTLSVSDVEMRNNVRGLTTRQRQIMELVVAGQPSKNIAADLGISRRTVENHRASIMRKTGSTSIPALVRLSIGAAVNGDIVKKAFGVRAPSA